MQIDRFNKDFPCNNQSVKVGESIWVSERVDGKSVRTLGTVISTSDTGITAEVKRSGYDFEFSFGLYGHRRHSRFGGTFRVLPVTETNNKSFSEVE